MAATWVPCVCRAEVILACLLLTPRTLIVNILTLFIMFVVLFLFPLCVCFLLVLGFTVIAGMWYMFCSGGCFCVAWGFGLWRFPPSALGSSQNVTRFVVACLILFLPCVFDSIPLFGAVVVIWVLVLVSCLNWVFLLGIILGFVLGLRLFWVSVVGHFLSLCRYLPTRLEMFVIMLCDRFSLGSLGWVSSFWLGCVCLCFLLSGLYWLLSLLSDRCL